MTVSTLERVRAKMAPAPIRAEDSITFRVAVAAAVMCGIAAVVAQDIVTNSTAVSVLILTPVGSVLSWYRREHRNIGLKFVLAATAVLALGDFLRSLSGITSVEEARAPLAQIFLWVQTLHSFDLPRRRDLHFSLATSITLVALGGSLAIDSSFLIYFIPWGLVALIALQLSYASEVSDKLPKPAAETRSRSVFPAGMTMTAIILVVVVLAGSVAFMFAPRSNNSRFTSVPFRIPNFLPLPSGAGIVNPGLPNQSGPGDEPVNPQGGAYFGFGNFMDLRARGKLSDDLVMRVRATRSAFWRGAVFDTYDKSSWTDSTERMRPLIGPPVHLSAEPTSAETVPLVQTFYVVAQQPNIIFAAYNPVEVWFPTTRIEVSDHLGLRSPVLLEPESVYSVVSRVPIYTRESLSQATVAPGGEGALPEGRVRIGGQLLREEFHRRYTQLPQGLPKRVKDLALEITGAEETVLGKALAIERWLAQNTEYEIDIPAQPKGTDAVDQFLFEDRRGYCEQIASSMALMLRAAGVPTRLATGYAPGDRNVLSGFFDVRQSDAHSWVEVFFPGVGWVEFDPTHEVPAASSNAESSPGLELLKTITAAIGRAVPDGMGAAAGRGLQAALRAVASNGEVAAVILLAVAAAIGGAALMRPRITAFLRRRRLRMFDRAPPGEALAGAFGVVEAAGRDAGMPRAPSATPREYAASLRRLLSESEADLSVVVSTLESHLYAGSVATKEQAARARSAAERVSESLLKSSTNL
ncbi:MAG TPA: DUF3488 and transglutaminase-like domain-containing protein [Actinomycetota bacterium]|nr:DUF3488 and transglutaminase-like domain-containing protein [Actinomycetota bacterium]